MIELLDEGTPCPGPLGGRWHHVIAINGHEWKRGDRFFITDHHGVPRPLKFSYHYTGNGSTVSYSPQRFRPADTSHSICAGFVNMAPVDSAVHIDDLTLEVQGLASDLLDIGQEHAALALMEVLAEGAGDELDKQVQHARAILDAHDDDDE